VRLAPLDRLGDDADYEYYGPFGTRHEAKAFIRRALGPDGAADTHAHDIIPIQAPRA
jgi:hypothetical protein